MQCDIQFNLGDQDRYSRKDEKVELMGQGISMYPFKRVMYRNNVPVAYTAVALCDSTTKTNTYDELKEMVGAEEIENVCAKKRSQISGPYVVDVIRR